MISREMTIKTSEFLTGNINWTQSTQEMSKLNSFSLCLAETEDWTGE